MVTGCKIKHTKNLLYIYMWVVNMWSPKLKCYNVIHNCSKNEILRRKYNKTCKGLVCLELQNPN